MPPLALAPLRTGPPSGCGSRPASTSSTFRSAAVFVGAIEGAPGTRLESPDTGKDVLRTRPFSRLQRPRAPHRNRGNARELRAFCRRPGKVGSDLNREPIVSSGAGRTRTSAASIVLGPVVLLAKLPRLANGRRLKLRQQGLDATLELSPIPAVLPAPRC